MEYQKFTNLLDTTSRFITKKWAEIHDQSGSAEDRYNPSKQIRFKTSVLRSDLCDFSDSYIAVKEKLLLILTIEKTIVPMIFLMNFFLIIFFLMERLLHK